MDIKKQREAFEAWLFSTEKFKFRNKGFLFMLDDYGNYEDEPVMRHWETWQAAKTQAVPDGFALVPKKPTERMLDSAYSSISDNLHYADLEKIYRAMIEAQEPANEGE